LEPGFTPVSHLEKFHPGIEEKYIELAKNSAPASDSQMAIQNHMKMLEAKAKQEITSINAADPGLNDKKSPGAKTTESLKKTAEGVTGPTGKNVKDSHIMLSGEPVIPGQPLTSKQMAGVTMGKMNGKTFHPEIEKQFDVQGGNKRMDKEKLQPPVPAKVPASASAIDQKSKEVETEKMNAMAPNKSANTTVIAPSTNVNNNSTTTNIKSPIRNQESTQREYFKNRYAY
jgi:hypothetical protein